MNKSYMVLFFMCTAGITHASQPNQQVVAVLPDWKVVDKELNKDCKNYFRHCLEEYKKNSTVNIHELLSVGSLITGRDCSYELSRTRDFLGNYFSHVAVKKGDLPTLEWIFNSTSNFNGACSNYCNETLLDLCLKKPDLCCEKNAVHMLHSTITYTAQSVNDPYKKTCLEKIITAQLEHKKNQKKLVLLPEVLRCLVPKEQLVQEELFLSTIYEQAADPVDGDTFTHVFVDQELPDELFDWIKQGRVSFEPNKAGMTAIDLALARFRDFTQHVELIKGDQNTFENRRCCLFMLLHYLKTKDSSQTALFGNCCDKHTIQG